MNLQVTKILNNMKTLRLNEQYKRFFFFFLQIWTYEQRDDGSLNTTMYWATSCQSWDLAHKCLAGVQKILNHEHLCFQDTV